jgi:hypothetical protein
MLAAVTVVRDIDERRKSREIDDVIEPLSIMKLDSIAIDQDGIRIFAGKSRELVVD